MSVINAKSVNFTGTQSTIEYKRATDSSADTKLNDSYYGKHYLQNGNTYIDSMQMPPRPSSMRQADATTIGQYGRSDAVANGMAVIGGSYYNGSGSEYFVILDHFFANSEAHDLNIETHGEYLYNILNKYVSFNNPLIISRGRADNAWIITEINRAIGIIRNGSSSQALDLYIKGNDRFYRADELKSEMVYDDITSYFHYAVGDITPPQEIIGAAIVLDARHYSWYSYSSLYKYQSYISKPDVVSYDEIDSYDFIAERTPGRTEDLPNVSAYLKQRLKDFSFGFLRVEWAYCIGLLTRTKGTDYTSNKYILMGYDDYTDYWTGGTGSHFMPSLPPNIRLVDCFIPVLSEDEYHAAKCALEEWSDPTIDMFMSAT